MRELPGSFPVIYAPGYKNTGMVWCSFAGIVSGTCYHTKIYEGSSISYMPSALRTGAGMQFHCDCMDTSDPCPVYNRSFA